MPASSMSLPHLSPSTQDGFVSVAPGVDLAYIDRGQGHPIILLTGWTWAKEVFEKQIQFLAQSHRVIAYDPRSQGASSFALEGNDYFTHAQDLDRLIGALGIRNPILVAWSAGAITAWNYLRSKGVDSIAGMISIDAPPKCISSDPAAWTASSLEEIAAIHTVYLRDAAGQASFVQRYAETVMVQRQLTEAELDWLTAQSLTTKPLIAAQLFASHMFSDCLAQAIAVAQARPCLHVISRHWPEKVAAFIKHRMPQALYVTFGGNMMFWEYPDAFNQVLEEFIRLHIAPRIAA